MYCGIIHSSMRCMGRNGLMGLRRKEEAGLLLHAPATHVMIAAEGRMAFFSSSKPC